MKMLSPLYRKLTKNLGSNNIRRTVTKDYSKHVSRNIGIYSSSVFGMAYMKRISGISGFSSVLWVIRNRNSTTFFRSEKEHRRFEKKAEKMCHSFKYASAICTEIRELSIWLLKKLKEDNLEEDKKTFTKNYAGFFTLHQIIYWSSQHIHINNPDKKEILELLDSTYYAVENTIGLIEQHLKNKYIDDMILNNHKHITEDIGLLFLKDKKMMIIRGKSLRKTEANILKKSRANSERKKLRGTGIFPGIVKGKATVIKDLNELRNIKKDSILVTEMTRPEFNSILKRCRAIVTDEGGYLCHASILCREQKIPCIVGVKTATEVIKNGDLIEVNSENGRISKIN